MNALTLVVLAALTGDLPFEAPGGSNLPPPAPPEVDAPHTRVRLVAREDAAIPGKPVDIAIVLESDEGWHTYWKNPGDAGMATSVTWKLSKGWRAGELSWPAPARFQEGDVATFGYAGTVWLLSAIESSGAKAGSELAIDAHVEWLECREICLSGSADVTLRLPTKAAGARDSHADEFKSARARLPASSAGWKTRASWTAGKKLQLDLVPEAPATLDLDAYFFPEQPGVVEPSVAPKLTAGAKGGYSLELTPARIAVGAPSTLEGVLVSGGRAWLVRVPLPPREI